MPVTGNTESSDREALYKELTVFAHEAWAEWVFKGASNMWYDVTLQLAHDTLYLQMQGPELKRLEAEWLLPPYDVAKGGYNGRVERSFKVTLEDGLINWKDKTVPAHVLVDLCEVIGIVVREAGEDEDE